MVEEEDISNGAMKWNYVVYSRTECGFARLTCVLKV